MRFTSRPHTSHGRLALLPVACTIPFATATPALAAEVTTLGPPPRAITFSPSDANVVARWQVHPESPWAPYEKTTLLSALYAGQPLVLPDVRRLDVVDHAIDAAKTAAWAGLPSDTMWVVDLRGAASVAFAATLSQTAREPVVPVLTFNNWPAEEETVPAEEALSALTLWQPSLASSTAVDARPVFVLDAWRLAYPTLTVDDHVTDNRYMLGMADLPDPTVLLRQGIARVVYVVESREESPHEEDDLNATFLAYEAAGIQLAVVDLDDLCYWPEAETPDPQHTLTLGWHAWGGWFNRYAYRAAERPTMVSDPLFYTRARGGFGVMPTAWSAHAAMGHGHGGG